MKSASILTALTAAISALAAPTVKRAVSSTTVSLVADAPGTSFQGGSINGFDYGFWIGKQTATLCPLASEFPDMCSSFTNTTEIILDQDSETASMNAQVAGGQTVYLDAENGDALAYTVPHSQNVHGGNTTSFTINADGYLAYDDVATWYACLATNETAWQIVTTPNSNSTDCCETKILAIANPDDTGIAAYQYA